MNAAMDDILAAAHQCTAAPAPQATATRPYTVKSWGEVVNAHVKPQIAFWGDHFRLGQLQTIAGLGGIGKSRLAMNVAFHQVLGKEFAGMPTHSQPLKHLFIGSENSIQRLQHDARAMQDDLETDQRQRLAANIFLSTIEQPDDSYLSLESDENIKRWRATLQQHRPDVLWVDPWGDVQAGDPNDNGAARASVQELMRLAREGNPDAGVVVITHSRTGAANLAQATGYNAANFMRGAKALFDCSRVVVNLAPGDESEHPPIVVVCSKANDTIRFDSFALRLTAESMLYERDDEFDINAWRGELEAAAKGKRARGKLPTDDEVLAPITEPLQATQFVSQLRGRGFSKAGADEVRRRLVQNGCLAQVQSKTFPRTVWIGRPDQIKALESKWAQTGQTQAA